MTEQDFREAMVARMAALTTAVDMLKIEMRESSKAQWDRIVDRFTAQEAATSIALTAAEKAVVKAEILATARSAQQDDRISDLSTRAEKSTGRGEGSKATLYGAAAAIASVVAIVSVIIQLSH
jgi:hypothetical protein